MILFDSHAHLHGTATDHKANSADPVEETLSVLAQGACQLCLCGTSPTTDWRTLAALLSRFKEMMTRVDDKETGIMPPVVGFGIHPWWTTDANLSSIDGSTQTTSNTASPAWKESLLRLLKDHPESIVAEIGLDKHRGAEHWDQQVFIFKEQLSIAAELNRPVSVHCVRAFGPIGDTLRLAPMFPPTLVLHGFTGSVDFAKGLLKLPKKRGSAIYFGFGAATTASLKHFGDLCECLPRDRVLVESDAFTHPERMEKLHAICEKIATHWQCPLEDVMSTCAANARAALCCHWDHAA